MSQQKEKEIRLHEGELNATKFSLQKIFRKLLKNTLDGKKIRPIHISNV